MKKITILICSLMMLVCLFGCGDKNTRTINNGVDKGAEKAANQFFDAVKKGDQKVLGKLYFGDSEDTKLINDVMKIFEETEALGDFGKLISDSIMDFKYDIKEVTPDGDNAIAKVVITTEDWGTLIPDLTVLLIAKSLSMVLDGKSDKEMMKEFKNLIDEKKKETKDIETEVEMKLINDNGEWKIDLSEQSDQFTNAISGGAY